MFSVAGKDDFIGDHEDSQIVATSVDSPGTHHRSKTTSSASPELLPRGKARQAKGGPTGEKLKIAKMAAERAIKVKNILLYQKFMR